MQRVGSRAQVMHGNAKQTGGGLKKKDLKYNKQGKIVSKKMSAMAKKEKRLQKAGYTTKKGQFGTVRTMRGGTNRQIKLTISIDSTDKRIVTFDGELTTISKVDDVALKKRADELIDIINKNLKSIKGVMGSTTVHISGNITFPYRPFYQGRHAKMDILADRTAGSSRRTFNTHFKTSTNNKGKPLFSFPVDISIS